MLAKFWWWCGGRARVRSLNHVAVPYIRRMTSLFHFTSSFFPQSQLEDSVIGDIIKTQLEDRLVGDVIKMPRADRSRFAFTVFGDLPTDEDLSRTILTNLQMGCEPSVAVVAWQVEMCPTTQHPHVQGFIRMKANSGLVPVKAIIHGLFGAQPHVEVCRRDEKANAEYVSKLEGRIHGPYVFGTLQRLGGDLRADFAALRDYLRHVDHLDDFYATAPAHMLNVAFRAGVAGVDRLWQSTRIGPGLLDYAWPVWSTLLIQLLLCAPMPRVIFFVVGPPNTGKTFLTLQLLQLFGRLALKVEGTPRDIFHAWNGQPLVIVDLPKATRMTPALTEACESLKTGVVFSTKYQSTMKRFAIPHVLVISNYDPPGEDVLAQDRVIIFRTAPGAETNMVPLGISAPPNDWPVGFVTI